MVIPCGLQDAGDAGDRFDQIRPFVYHHHLPVTRHINVVHYRYGGCCGYFGPRRAYRWHGFRRYW